ncbi:hypothetical protein RJ035_007964 [Blastomyces gilchristii]
MPAFVVNFEGASLDSVSFSRNKLSFERERFGKTPVRNPRVHDNLPKPYEIIWSMKIQNHMLLAHGLVTLRAYSRNGCSVSRPTGIFIGRDSHHAAGVAYQIDGFPNICL